MGRHKKSSAYEEAREEDLALANFRENPHYPEGHVAEAGLARLSNKLEGGFALITAWRGDLPVAVNKGRCADLLVGLRTLCVGPIRLVGEWSDGLSEDSFLCVKPVASPMSSFVAQVVRQARTFDQIAVLVGDGQGVSLVWADGRSCAPRLGKPSVTRLAVDYSDMRGKSDVAFVFRGVSRPSSHLSAMAFRSAGVEWV